MTGHADAVHVALALIVHQGRWLVARRRPDAHLGGLWEFPGGKCQPGEPPQNAAVREAREECGIEVEALRVMPTFSHDYGDRIVHLTPVVCQWLSGEPMALDSEECRWATLSEIRRLEMPAVNHDILRELELHA